MGFLGSLLGNLFSVASVSNVVRSVGGYVLGKVIDRRSDKRLREQRYNQMRAQGFTHSEIAGMGGLGGSEGSGGPVLGNQFNAFQQQRNQLQFEAEQRQADRETDLARTAIQAGAGVQASQISAGASRYGADTQARIAEAQLAPRS